MMTIKKLQNSLRREHGMECKVFAGDRQVMFFGTEEECSDMRREFSAKKSTAGYSLPMKAHFISFPEWWSEWCAKTITH